MLILQKEALDQNARARIAKKKLSKDFQQFQKLSKTRIEKAKNHLLHELIAAQTKANSLEQLVNEQDESHRNFIVKIDSLKRAISQRDEHIALITQGGIEANSELSTELNQTTTALSAAKNQLSQLQDQLRKQTEELDSKTVTHNEFITDKNRLTTELRDTKRILNEHQEEERQLEYVLNDTRKHLNEALTKAKRNDQILHDRTRDFKEAQQSFDTKTDLYNFEVTRLKQQLLNTTSHNTSLEDTNLSLQTELLQSGKTDQFITKLRERAEEQDRQISELFDSNNALKSELHQVTDRNTELQQENIELKDTHKALEDSISKLTVQVTQSISTNTQLDQRITYLLDTVTIREQRIQELQDKIDSLNDPSILDPFISTPRRRLNFNNTTFTTPNRTDSPSLQRQQTPFRMVNTPYGTGQATAPDLATPLVQKLGELFSREEKKTIPTYKGKTSDKPVTDWLKTAERVAQNNNWDPPQRIRFFSDRLGGEAID